MPQRTRLYAAFTGELEDESLFRDLFACLPPVRRDKVTRMRPLSGKRQSLAAGALLMYALAREGHDMAALPMALGEFGKPYFPDLKETYVNLSHTDGLVLCALSDHPVGCDAEGLIPGRLRVAERFYAPAEQDILKGIRDEGEKDLMFYRLWTLKESYIKAIGTGFSKAPETYAIIPPDTALGRGGTPYLLEEPDRFSFREYRIENFRCALCLDGCLEEDIKIQEISLTTVRDKLYSMKG